MSEQAKTQRTITDFAAEFLADDAVAIIVKQQLSPDDVENPVIFPPTYLPARGGNAQDSKGEDEEKKKTNKEQQKAIYNLDELGDGKNVVEIDSPQSDGNRTEPLFKSGELRKLVPQIDIKVGTESRSILDAGHRAADALVRFSSLAAEFHAAFERTRMSPADHSMLATLAPTSLLYGAYDSRSTQSKLQRIIKASVRAENVKPIQKSATFIPAVGYVAAGAIKEELDVGERDNNPLSSEGMKHALASQTLGGVRLTDPKLLVRTIKINLTAIRALNAVADPLDPPKPLPHNANDEQRKLFEKELVEFEQRKHAASESSNVRTGALRKYVLGLALTVAKATPDLNLREGCNLRITGQDKWILVRHRHNDEDVSVGEVSQFAVASAQEFFKAMRIDFEKKDHPNVTFEKDVAEEFLGLTDSKGKLSSTERDKVRALGPITRATLEQYKRNKKKREKSGDPIEVFKKLVDGLTVSKSGRFNKGPREKLSARIAEIDGDSDSRNDLKSLTEKIKPLLTEDSDATERKEQMLALFPAASNTIASEQKDQAAEAGQ